MRHSLKGVKIESIILSAAPLLSLLGGVNGPHKFISSPGPMFLLEIGAVSEIEPISQASKSEESSHAGDFPLLRTGVNWSLLHRTGENQFYLYRRPF